MGGRSDELASSRKRQGLWLMRLETAISFLEEFGFECAYSAECAFSQVSVLITLRLTHAVIKGIGAENRARIRRGELQ